MKKSILFFIVVIFIIFEHLSAQPNISILGTIIDDSNHQPVSNVNILIENSSLGTMTNNEGRFVLTIPQQLTFNYLNISHLGYNELRIAIRDLMGCDSVIKIQGKVIQLQEVEIIESTPQALLKKVLSRIPENYGSDPIILTGFLRMKKMVNDSLAEFSEAIIEDYKSGYYLYPKREIHKKALSTDIPNLIKGRVITDTLLLNELIGTGDYAYPVGSYFIDQLECYHGWLVDPAEFKMYTYFLTKMSDQDGNFTYKIAFDQKAGTKGLLYKGEVFIDPEDFAIKKIVVTYSPNGYAWYNSHYGTVPYTIRKMTGWKGQVPLLKATTTWCRKNEKWFLHSKVIEWEEIFSHPMIMNDFHYNYQQEIVIMDYTRSQDKINSFRGNKQLGLNENWEKLVGEVDEAFWDNFNYIPIEETLRNAIMNMPSIRGK